MSIPDKAVVFSSSLDDFDALGGPALGFLLPSSAFRFTATTCALSDGISLLSSSEVSWLLSSSRHVTSFLLLIPNIEFWKWKSFSTSWGCIAKGSDTKWV